jgi:hypothetical protein
MVRNAGAQLIRERIGVVASFKTALVVQRLHERSGEILRGTMRRIADGEECKMGATIDDPVILDEIADTFEGAYANGALICIAGDACVTRAASERAMSVD